MRDSKGRFTKDNTGRPKGAKDKLTQEAKELFIQTLESQVEHIKDAFDEVRTESAKEYLELFAKYAQYFVPKKTHTELDTKDDIVISFKE